jgi:predicted secreted hydrolase
MSYILQNLAAVQGNAIAIKNRDISLKQLSREQVTEGQRLASEWQVGTPLPTSSDTKTWP